MFRAERLIRGIKLLSVKDEELILNRRKWEIFKHHSANNGAYSQLIGNAKISSWSDIPIMRKSDLQNKLSYLLTEGMSESKLYVNSTSGSSGTPFHFAINKDAHSLSWAYNDSEYAKHHITPFSMEARFYGIPRDRKTQYKERLKDYCLRRKRFNVFDLSDEQLELWLVKFSKIKFEYLYGYTNTILVFSKFLTERGIVLSKVCPSLKVCIVTAEMCSDTDKRIIHNAIGTRVVREYGASEVGIIALEDENNEWRINNTTLYVETHIEEGLTKILVTSLFNKAFPLIRYELGDLVELSESYPQYLTKLLGRTNDIIRLPSGKIAPGLTFYYISRAILEDGIGLTEFVIIQRSLSGFEFQIVSRHDLSQIICDKIIRETSIYLEEGLKLEFKRVDEIDRPASGKFKHFISQI